MNRSGRDSEAGRHAKGDRNDRGRYDRNDARRPAQPQEASRSVNDMFDWIPNEQSEPALDGEKLQKVIARAGLVSRRGAELFIDEGRVRVNGEIAQLGRRVEAATDRIGTVRDFAIPQRGIALRHS